MIWFGGRGGRTVNPAGRRVLGRSLESGDPVFGLRAHSLTYGANGTGKSTRVAVPAICAFAAATPRPAVFVTDSKSGELAAQCVPMLEKLGIPVAVVDNTNVRPELAKHRIELNAFGGVVQAYKRDPRDAVFAMETITHALIEEPKDDAKNKYFRAWPRNLIAFAIGALLKRDPDKTTPGAVSVILADPEMLKGFAAIEAEEGEGALKTDAQAILAMSTHEHWPQHLEEAQRALKLYAPGTRLHEAGQGATLTHDDLIRGGYFTFVVGSQDQIGRMSVNSALHTYAMTSALYRGAGPLRIIADEFTNTPSKELIDSLTTLRAFGPTEVHLLCQSRSEVVRKFGEQEALTLEDNCLTIVWLSFSFAEAERISKAMGEQHAVASGLSGDETKAQESLSLVKQPWMSPGELMAMPAHMALCHVNGVGFFFVNTISQNQIAPFCKPGYLADNPLEGGRLPPDPKIRFKVPRARR